MGGRRGRESSETRRSQGKSVLLEQSDGVIRGGLDDGRSEGR